MNGNADQVFLNMMFKNNPNVLLFSKYSCWTLNTGYVPNITQYISVNQSERGTNSIPMEKTQEAVLMSEMLQYPDSSLSTKSCNVLLT